MTASLKTKNTGILVLLFCVAIACKTDKKQQEHYFLDGYDHLEFRNQTGDKSLPESYIYATQINGMRGYFLRDSSLILYNTRAEIPYSGYIRTFHGRRYNLQGEFKNGKMDRLRYWHGNRALGMDVDYTNNTGTIWNEAGAARVSWNTSEMYYYNSITERIKQIITDTLTSYFNKEGDLTSYTVRNDSATIYYYANGRPRFMFPSGTDGLRDGSVKRWHPNGQLQAEGQYKDGEQSGLWIEYDSLGFEINRETFNR